MAMIERRPYNRIIAFELYLKGYLTNSDIGKLFDIKETSINKIKKAVLEETARRGIYMPRGKVDAAIAYEVWGIDTDTLERNYTKAKKYQIA